MSKHWEVIDLLRHYRHDWLNTLQLIKGNLALNKIDQVERVIAEVVLQTENESKLSNLNIPDLAEMILTFNWSEHAFKLEYEIIGEIKDLSCYKDDIMNWFEMYFAKLDECCKSFTENSLLITFQLFKDEMTITFDYNGELKNLKELEQWLNNSQMNEEKLLIIEKDISHEEIIVIVSLKEKD
jgi:stage 0 sporulation protein B (sporulation initiation phosphotransferase)